MRVLIAEDDTTSRLILQEILTQLGFSPKEIDGLQASGTVPKARERAA